MANEITATAVLKVLKGNVDITRPMISKPFTMNGTAYGVDTVSVPTTSTGTALVTPSAVGTGGWSYFVNIDTTNYVEVGVQVSGTFYPVVKLKAGEFGMFRIAVLTLFARANTAAVELEHWIVED
jgi:hypothetical protein